MRSFTLLELLLVISVILILAGLSLPNFFQAKERVLEKEAIATLKILQAAQKIYRTEMTTTPTDAYFGDAGGTSDINGINTNLKVKIPSASEWTYTVYGNNGTVTATRGPKTFTLPINQDEPS